MDRFFLPRALWVVSTASEVRRERLNPLAPLASSSGHSEDSFSRSRDRSDGSQQNSKNDEAGQYERMQGPHPGQKVDREDRWQRSDKEKRARRRPRKMVKNVAM